MVQCAERLWFHRNGWSERYLCYITAKLKNDGFKSLDEGQPVQFEIRQNDKGDYAANVIKL